MNKDKLKHLPINMFLSISVFLLVYLTLNTIDLKGISPLLISLFIYIRDAVNESKFDYLEEQIKLQKHENKSIN